MDYIKVFLVLAPQLIAGCLIYFLILKRNEVALVELLSIGGVFGIVSSTIFDQIFVNLQLPPIGWLVPLLIALVIFRIVQKNQAIVLPKIQTEQAFKKTILPILAISAAAIGTEWFWLFPSGVLFCFAAFLSIAPKQTYSHIVIRLTNLAALIAGVIMIANRPKIWWILNEGDYPFLQGLSRSLADWGIRDYFLLSGTTTKYHWFTYAWIGLVERAATAKSFFVFTRIAPVVFVVLITGIVWSLINRVSKTKLQIFAAALVIMTASSHLLTDGGVKLIFLASPSQVYAFALLLTTVFIFIDQLNDAIRKPSLILSALSVSTMLSKAPHGFILVFSVLFTISILIILKKEVKRKTLLSCISIVVFSLLTYFALIESTASQAIYELRLGDFYWQLQGDAKLLSDKKIALIGTLTIIALIILPLQLTLTNVISSVKGKSQPHEFLSLGSLIAGTGAALVMLGVAGENFYFLNASIFLASTLGFASLARTKNQHLIGTKTFVLLVSLGMVLCLASYQIPNINSGGEYAIILRSMRIYTPGLLILLFTVLIWLSNTIRKKPFFSSGLKMIVISSAMVTSFAMVNWVERAPRKTVEFSRDGETYVGSTNLIELSNWVNKNTNKNVVVASNFGWPKVADDELKSYGSLCLPQRDKNAPIQTCKRTGGTMLVAYMRRRTWVQATGLHYTGFTPETNKRQTTTLEFSTEPNAEHLHQMRSDGVAWYVVDRSTTDRTNWEPFATVRFTNDSFYVLELNTRGWLAPDQTKVGRQGIEPWTCGLKVRRSTN